MARLAGKIIITTAAATLLSLASLAPPGAATAQAAPRLSAHRVTDETAHGSAGQEGTQSDERPSTIVAIGDSAAAGEGAGDYLPGTRGERGNWCHRSANAYIRRANLAEVPVNLACSGATSAQVGFGPHVHNTEGSQAQRLIEIARTHRVTTIVAQLGANDEPGFGDTVVRCVAVFLNPALPNCSLALDKQWPERLAAMEPKVEQALRDVRTAMRRAGYSDKDYVLVLASYPSPVTEAMTRAHALGCPFRPSDARWGRTVAVPALSEALARVADRVGARFLDLSRATEGHEACSAVGPEWQRRLTVNPRAFVHGGLAAVNHLAQESFHPNTEGHRQLAGCLAEFVRADVERARCLVGSDGQLHAETVQPRSAPA